MVGVGVLVSVSVAVSVSVTTQPEQMSCTTERAAACFADPLRTMYVDGRLELPYLILRRSGVWLIG